MIPFDEYRDRFRHLDLVREDGIVQLTMHTDGDSLIWEQDPYDELTEAFRLLADDHHNRIAILTGTGETFIDRPGPSGVVLPITRVRPFDSGRAITVAQLDVGIPIIAAVNGPVRVRSEIALLCDVVLAAVGTVFPAAPRSHRDKQRDPHREVSAAEALRMGLVAEVVEADQLADRAWELAGRLRALPQNTLRYTRQVFVDGARPRFVRVGPAAEGVRRTAPPHPPRAVSRVSPVPNEA